VWYDWWVLAVQLASLMGINSTYVRYDFLGTNCTDVRYDRSVLTVQMCGIIGGYRP